MGYLHIPNLYRPEGQHILAFRECWALEKIHGSSAHISFKSGEPRFFAGGESHENFLKCFDVDGLRDRFVAMGHPEVFVFGEVYGGRCQGMSATYGKELAFVAFDVKVGETWLSVPDADSLVRNLGLEFVNYWRTSTDIGDLDAARDRPSFQAFRRGCGTDKMAEGVVLRPPFEVRLSNGDRLIAKHKRPEFSERKSKKDTVVDPGKREVLAAAEAIATEWVTPMRLQHVLSRLTADLGRTPQLEEMRTVIEAMTEDVYREGRGEVVESREASRAIGAATAKLMREQARGPLG